MLKIAISIDIRNLKEYLYSCKNENDEAFGCVWIRKFENI